MIKKFFKTCILIFCIGLITPNAFAQWKYPNAKNIKNDIIITYEVKYDNELSEKQKKSYKFKEEIVVIFNGDKLVEKSISNNSGGQIFSLIDYNKELVYNCVRSNSSKNAIVSKFREPVKPAKLQGGKVENIIGFECEVYTTNIKGETREIFTTKKLGLKFVKQFMVEGFLLKYTSNDKYFGPYTVTAKKIFYSKAPDNTYSLKGFKIETTEERKEYIERRKEKSNKNKEKNIERVGEESPNFSARSLQGKKIKTKKFTNKILVLNFWFTNCSPCKKEIPQLNKLKEKFKGKDVEFVAIALDQEYKIAKFLKQNPFNYDIIEDGRWIAERFDVSLYPTNIIIDKKGIYQFVKTGYKSDITEAMSFKIDKLLENN